ncbi:hypothetical protein ARMGADRAFT_1088251 [Armillaria gallica]|uniref:Uncharacterized protein n=1 Tax=Armillaria gallica TaxID=47427 RepID=A0A2H3CN83_ARMGA|nr:hypothetical protein ARMGADRAFT_1088251 [Armillaria gallica]
MSGPMRIGYLILALSSPLFGACKTSLRILHTQSYNATVGEEIVNDTREKTQSQSDSVGIASEQQGRHHLNFPLEIEPKKQLGSGGFAGKFPCLGV